MSKLQSYINEAVDNIRNDRKVTKALLDDLIQYMAKEESRHRDVGMTAAKLDDVLNLIPARLTAIFLMLAACFVPTANPKTSFTTMMRDAGKHKSMNAGWPEAAMAGALNIALAGPRKYSNAAIEDPWIGTGTAKVLIKDINRALYMYVVANLINLAWVGSIALLRLNINL